MQIKWDTCCGNYLPSLAAQDARDAGQTFEEYAQDYVDNWPFKDEPLEAGEADAVVLMMVGEMESNS